MDLISCRIKPYIQPFERQLAINELRALTSVEPTPIDGDYESASVFVVPTLVDPNLLRSDLAYWESVGVQRPYLTAQLRGEATSLIARNGVALHALPQVVPDLVDVSIPKKRCLRYATHGLHEYRGKFFPQLVRVFMNLIPLRDRAVVLDPLCGSGTTIVEAFLSGRRAYGLDLNPLSVFMSRVKTQALRLSERLYLSSFDKLSRVLHESQGRNKTLRYFQTMSEADQQYLSRWFAHSTLYELDGIHDAISELPLTDIQDFYSVCLSNIIRGVSWQKEDDLRVRKEIVSLKDGEIVRRFLNEALRSTKMVVAFLAVSKAKRLGSYEVCQGDARNVGTIWPELLGRVDAVITSPPYATALPYLDTDRLSLIYLGLLPRNEQRTLDGLMIGNREITDRGRDLYWKQYEVNRELLPPKTRQLIETIDGLNRGSKVGFRRRNLAVLLSKYFFDMREVLQEQHALLRAKGTMFLVVGNNRTIAGGEPIEINTAEHLLTIAESLGFRLADDMSMEMLVSRDIFRKNTMPSEQILILEKR